MTEKINPADFMVKFFKDDATQLARLKTDPNPVAVLEEAATKAKSSGPAYRNDIVLYRVAVSVLGALALLAALGSIVLQATDKTIPEGLVALGSAAVGGLVGLFAPSPATTKE